MNQFDLIIIGAGPAGLACAIEARNAGLSYLVLEKGSIVNSIRQFQHSMNFFSTPEMLEIGNIPFVVPTTRPTTIDCVNYYRRVALHFDLRMHSFERVEWIRQGGENFSIGTSRGISYSARFVVIATGYYDWPNRLRVPGEDLPHIFHYYRDPYMFAGQRVVVVGGKNSAVEAALDLHRHGAKVTVVHRGPAPSAGVKYWILPDFENRVREHSIAAHFDSVVTEFYPDSMQVRTSGGDTFLLAADFVFVLIGYAPDTEELRSYGIHIDEETGGPVHNPGTMETNVRGCFIAGGLAGGRMTNRVFIENGRRHGGYIITCIRERMASTG